MPPPPLSSGLSEGMRKEIGGLVFSPKSRAAADHFRGAEIDLAAKAPLDTRSAEFFNERAAPFDASHVYGTQHEGMDTADHFEPGLSLGDHVVPKQGMGMESMNERAATYDLVYGDEHNEKDTADHFGDGMNIGVVDGKDLVGDDHAYDRHNAALEARAQRAAAAYQHSDHSERKEQTHMGHEQAGGNAGDTYDHFDQHGMGLAQSADLPPAAHHAYANRHTLDHFAHGMAVDGEAEFDQHRREAMADGPVADGTTDRSERSAKAKAAASRPREPKAPLFVPDVAPERAATGVPPGARPTSTALRHELARRGPAALHAPVHGNQHNHGVTPSWWG